VSGRDVRAALLTVPVPDELEAQRRAWRVVSAARAEREPLPRRSRRLRPLLALAVLAAVVAAALSPPGRAVGDWIRDRVAGQEDAEPALVRLPAPGRLLVVSDRGPWIVRRDGSKRFLGRYEDASFSPSGSFVVVTGGRRVVAVEPDGDPRWTVTRPELVADGRWAPSGFRVAYRAGDTLRVVVGNGERDRRLAERVAEVAPAWRPEPAERNVLAYAGADGRVHVVDVDTRRELSAARPTSPPEKLVWSDDGQVLLVVTTGGRHPLYGGGPGFPRELRTPGLDVLDAELEPGTRTIAYTTFDAGSGRSTVWMGPERLQTAEGRLEEIVFSPDGRWLLAGWPEADQLLFLPLRGREGIVAVDDVRREFDPGRPARGAFPRLAGWCCS
jgi:hypothetical protein